MPEQVEREQASHDSARHLLSDAVVDLFEAKPSLAAAWSLGEKIASEPGLGGSGVTRVILKVAGQPPGLIVAIIRRRDTAIRP